MRSETLESQRVHGSKRDRNNSYWAMMLSNPSSFKSQTIKHTATRTPVCLESPTAPRMHGHTKVVFHVGESIRHIVPKPIRIVQAFAGKNRVDRWRALTSTLVFNVLKEASDWYTASIICKRRIRNTSTSLSLFCADGGNAEWTSWRDLFEWWVMLGRSVVEDGSALTSLSTAREEEDCCKYLEGTTSLQSD